MKILIVDDNEQARQMIRQYLREMSDEFCECKDGAEAVHAYAEFQPDWVLMDIELGATGGIAATRAIKTKYPAAKVVMVTNYNDREMREAAAAGAHGFVLKDDLLALQSFLKVY